MQWRKAKKLDPVVPGGAKQGKIKKKKNGGEVGEFYYQPEKREGGVACAVQQWGDVRGR